jgi:hypothetical protein
MSLSQQLVKQFENTLDVYINNIAEKYSLDKNELEQLWNGNETKMKSKTKPAKTTIQVDMDDLSPERLLKCTKVELSALCKSHGKKCTGKKEELIARLQDKEAPEPAKTKAPVKTKAVGKAARATESHDVIKKLTSNILAVPVRTNTYGNLVHPETQLVFNKSTKKVCGRQEDDGTVSELNDDDVENCKRFKFPYDIPGNLDKKGNSEKVKVEELEDDEDAVVVEEDDEEEEVVVKGGEGDDDEDEEDEEEEEIEDDE